MARFLNNHSLLAGVPLLAFLALLGLLLLASSARAANIHLQTDSEGWHRGRATYFGASPELVETFERVRGAGSYGDLHYGSCGMYRKPQVRSAFWVVEKKKGNQREEREKNERRGKKTKKISPFKKKKKKKIKQTNKQGVQTIRPKDLPFDQTYAAAAADANPDFPGSCGRCYEVGCVPGVVPKDYHDDKGSMTPFKTMEHFYMPKVDQDLHDTQGRKWLGNPWEKEGLQGALCWGNETTWVRIVDSCPPNPLSPWCKADSTVFHFDMSYWAFEKLAHPLYGVMPIRFRPVDCETKRPLVVDSKAPTEPTTNPDPATATTALTPGFISKDLVYEKGLRPGWTMFTWLNGYQLLSVHGAAEAPTAPPKKKESPACASLLPGGGMRFACRGCQAPGYQPFLNSTHVSFRVKADNSVMKFPSTPAGSVPPLKAYLIRAGTGGAEENYCGEAFLRDWPETKNATLTTAPLASEGWHQFDIPISKFMCNSPTGAELIGFGLSHANATVPVNNGAGAKQEDYLGICVDSIAIRSGVVPGFEPKPVTWAGGAAEKKVDDEGVVVAVAAAPKADAAAVVAPRAPAAAAAAAAAGAGDEKAAPAVATKARWASSPEEAPVASTAATAAPKTTKAAAAPVAGAATATAKSA